MSRRRLCDTARAPSFDLRIGELVLDGYATGEAHAVAQALEQELGRLRHCSGIEVLEGERFAAPGGARSAGCTGA